MTVTTTQSIVALDHIANEITLHIGPIMAATRLVRSASQVMCTGVGKSLIVAQMAASLLRSVGVPAVAVHATDMLHGDINHVSSTHDATVIVFSNSGRTDEVAAVADAIVQRVGGALIAVTSTASDRIGREANIWLSYPPVTDGSKHRTIPTASVTAQLGWVNEIVCRIANTRTLDELASGHEQGVLYEGITA